MVGLSTRDKNKRGCEAVQATYDVEHDHDSLHALGPSYPANISEAAGIGCWR